MKILIAASIPGDGGYEEEKLVMLLDREYRAQGHTVDYFFLPYERNMLSLLDQILAYQLFRIENCELLITVGYLAAMLKHPNKICYLMQTEPMMFEYWDSAYGVIANYQYGMIRNALICVEQDTWREAKKIFCASECLKKDLDERYSANAKTLLYPNLHFPEQEVSKEQQPYAVCESYLLPWQRWEKLLPLAKHTKILLFVPNTNPIYLESAERIIRRDNMESRIVIQTRRCTAQELDGASYVITADYQARKITGLVRGAIEYQKPIAAFKDCGALFELLPKENLISIDNIDSFSPYKLRAVQHRSDFLSGLEFAKELLK